MRKLLLILCIGLIPIAAYSPNPKVLTVATGEAINPYLRLMEATGIVESSNNPLAFNPLEMACGIYQIRPIRLVDYFQRTGKLYSLQDCFNEETSKEIWLYYASQYRPDELETIAKAWNGSGKLTDDYWAKVESVLQKDCNLLGFSKY